MSVLTHKEATTRNPAARPRKLEDLSRWQEQLAIRKKIETELRDAEAADRLANGSQQTPEDNRVSRFIARLWAKVSGALAAIFTEADEVTAAEKLLAVRRAMEQQQRHMESLRHELDGQVVPGMGAEALCRAATYRRAAVELAEAVQDEQATATQMYQAGHCWILCLAAGRGSTSRNVRYFPRCSAG